MALESKWKWFLLMSIAIAFLAAFGIQGTLMLVLCAGLIIAGFFAFLVQEGLKKRKAFIEQLEQAVNNFEFSQGVPFLLRNKLRFKQFIGTYAEKHSMTGSDTIDPILEQMSLQLVFEQTKTGAQIVYVEAACFSGDDVLRVLRAFLHAAERMMRNSSMDPDRQAPALVPKISPQVYKGAYKLEQELRPLYRTAINGCNFFVILELEKLHREDILQYIIRDFIDSWYKNVTPDILFQESLKRTARRTIAAFSHCLKKVDWLPLLTRHFVDDFASHLRLYRKAKEKLQMQKENLVKMDDLESVFFDLELEMEKSYCRDLISTSPLYESAYLHDIVDILLYLLMPSEDFRSRPLRFLIREVFVTRVFVPLLDKLSDPLYVNYLIVWLLSELPISTDDFVTTLETCQSVQELEAILESVHEEMNSLRSKDNGGEHSETFKQQLGSLDFIQSLIKRRMVTLANKPEVVVTTQSDELGEEVSDESFVHLPITVVLTHSLAISFFVDFLMQVGGQNYIDFYLSIEGFKVSVEHQLRGLASGEIIDSEVNETVKEAALFMYHQYLSQEAITKVPLEESIINKFLARLRNDEPWDSWFEPIQEKLVEILSKDEHFYPAFKKHTLYLKMLEELGILTHASEGPASCPSSNSPSVVSATEEEAGNTFSTTETLEMFSSSSSTANGQVAGPQPTEHTQQFATSVVVDTLGVGQQGKQMFALYNVRVLKTDPGGQGKSASSWNVIRRYSDFHLLNAAVTNKFPNLRNLSFPGKKTFNNLDQLFLEKRCKALNAYMSCLLQPQLLNSNPGLEAEIFDFLSQKCYKGVGARDQISKKLMADLFVNPILSGVKAFGSAVTAVPDQVFDGINKAANQVLKASASSQPGRSNSYSSTVDFNRVAAHLGQNDSNESIPLRVILLFVDEVFGLRGRNQWFRRRLVALLRQFVNAALGSSINRRIIDAVQWLTSGEQVAQYLVAFRDSQWNEAGVVVSAEQNPSTEALRTRKHNNNWVNNISEALQNKHLNRRFWYVVLERLLVTIFPNNKFEKTLPMLHSKSPRSKFV
uniref:Sorting nexin-13 n=1 Tax=Ditylenchus dipsaci TaxID=166011 RepID=A0A915DFP3_9BILA